MRRQYTDSTSAANLSSHSGLSPSTHTLLYGIVISPSNSGDVSSWPSIARILSTCVSITTARQKGRRGKEESGRKCTKGEPKQGKGAATQQAPWASAVPLGVPSHQDLVLAVVRPSKGYHVALEQVTFNRRNCANVTGQLTIGGINNAKGERRGVERDTDNAPTEIDACPRTSVDGQNGAGLVVNFDRRLHCIAGHGEVKGRRQMGVHCRFSSRQCAVVPL